MAGGLFSLTTKVEPKGEAIAFGVFSLIAFGGCALAFGIRGEKLEADGLDEEEGSEDSDEEDDDS